MKGHNAVFISGNVGGNIVSGMTKDNSPASSFSVATEDTGRGTTWVRVNVYGSLALKCKQNITKGTYVSLIGELMNRNGIHGELTEVRARNILFFQQVPSELKEGSND
jgi:single-stranded DNA-binding protein